MAILTTAPWTESVTNIPTSMIAVIYDTRLAWSQEACEYYCDQRGIPRDNLLGLTLTPTPTLAVNGYPQWSPTTAQLVAVCTTIAVHFNAVAAAGVVFGPGFPTLANLTKSNAGAVVPGETLATSLPYILAASRMIVDRHTTGWEICVVGDVGPSSLLDKNASTPLGDGVSLNVAFAGWENLGVEVEVLSGATEGMLYPHPTLAQMQLAYDGSRSVIPFGILGWPIPEVGRLTAQTAESLITIKALIDRVSTAMKDAALNTTKRALPTLYSLIDVGGSSFSMPEHKFYCNKLIEWGLDVEYYYPRPATDGGTAPLVAGQWHTPSELAAGVTPLQYFMRLGATINGQDTAGGVYDSNQSPLAGGVSMVSGESYGTRANHHALAEQGACAGTVETMHINALYGLTQLGKHALLLRGMTMLEACAWTSAIVGEFACQVPCGDPLYAPYGAKRFRVTGTLTEAPAVTLNMTPAAFNFGSNTTNNSLSQQNIQSGNASITGINVPAPFTFTSNGAGEWRKSSNSGASWTGWSTANSGFANNLDLLQIQHDASPTNSTTVSSTITFTNGPVSSTFTSTTVAASGFSITSAILSSGVFTITGSDFGTKPTPIAPLVFKPLVGFADGLDIEDASTGYAAVQYTDSPTPPTRPKPAIYNADGIGGAAVRTQGRSYTASETQDVVNHVGVILSGTHKELIVNIWHKLTVTAGTPNSVLVKYMRGGMLNPADATSLEAGYHYRPKMGGMYYMNSSGTYDTSDASNFRLYVYSSSGTDEWNVDMNQGSAPYPVPTTAWGQWWNDESHFKFNDYGSSNGFARLTVNNKLAVVQTNINPVQDAGTIGFQFITPTPDISSGSGLGADFDIYHSRLYIDTTEARVFLGNASTIGACTGRFMLGPTAWATGSITAEAACFSNTVPATWDWVYVVKSDGTISAGYRWRGP